MVSVSSPTQLTCPSASGSLTPRAQKFMLTKQQKKFFEKKKDLGMALSVIRHLSNNSDIS